MAASDLRSPPARPTLHDRLGILSSSPSFPDLQELIAIKSKPKPPILRSGSAAAPIPTDASTVFTSASDLLRIARATGDDSFDVIDEPDPPVASKAPAKRARKTVKEAKAPKEAKKPKTGKSSKRVAKEVIVLSSDGLSPKFARRVDSIEAETGDGIALDADGFQSNESTPLGAKPWKKFKAPTSPDLKDAREVKAGGINAPDKKAKPRCRKSEQETVSRHFGKGKELEAAEPENLIEKKKRSRAITPEPTNLEFAVQRRVDWTPPKPDTLTSHPSPGPSNTQEALISTNADEDRLRAADLFKSLRDTYGHKSLDAATTTVPEQQPAQVLGKRKVIEMVSLGLSSKQPEIYKEPSPAKVKAPKKKPRTITELATAAYAPKVDEEDSGKDDSLLEYFLVEDPKHNTSKGATAKSKGKALKVTKSKKAAAPKKPVLLSPQSAMRQSAAQDFIFGTSSQLAREKSPTFLRDLHAAMKASTISEVDDPIANPSNKGLPTSKVRGKGLWSVSARDEEGDVVNVKILEMINSPTLPQDDAILDPWTQLPPEKGSAETGTADSSVIEIDSRPIATDRNKPSEFLVPKSHFFVTQKKTINAAAAISPKQSSDESFPMVTDLLEDEMPPPSNQQQTQEGARDSPSSKKTVPTQKPRPKYETFTDVKLAKEISKFGFKAVKTRTGMIALLDQCWRRTTQAAVTGASFSTSSVLASPKRKQADGASEILASSPSPAKKSRGRPKKATDTDKHTAEASTEDLHTSPKKKVGRPRKTAAAAVKTASSTSKSKAGPSTPKRKRATAQAELVVRDSDLDSEMEASASSPDQIFSPSGVNADVSIGDDTEITLNLSPTAQQAALFRYITTAVTSAPRTTDPDNPSWHEKMLMYDPIILEDLTAWLNSGELTKLGYDDEVSPLDVKKWCELRSICCLWKGNWHGKERKRF